MPELATKVEKLVPDEELAPDLLAAIEAGEE
jgi:hypothetical protein